MTVTDTLYDSRGNPAISNGPYSVTSAAPSAALWQTTETQIPDQTATAYDGAGRPAEADVDDRLQAVKLPERGQGAALAIGMRQTQWVCMG